jgi:hypothetical protein
VRRAADILLAAGILTEERAADILLVLGTALRARGRQPGGVADQVRRLSAAASLRGAPRPAPPAWRVLTTVPSQAPGSHLMAMVVTAGRMIAPATLHFPPSAGLDDLTPPAFADLSASDDAGTRYKLTFTDNSWVGSTWTGTILLFPAPPSNARFLSITSPNGPLLSVALTHSPATAPVAATVGPADDSPGERVLHRRAEVMLSGLGTSQPGRALQPFSYEDRRRAVDRLMEELGGGLPTSAGPVVTTTAGHGPLSRPSLPELVATLEGAGVLPVLSAVPAQVARLAEALGGPPGGPRAPEAATISAPASRPRSAGPGAAEAALPSRWANVLAHYGRRHHPALAAGTGSIGAELPEVEGASLVIAGVRTSQAGTELHVVGCGRLRMPQPGHDPGLSWWVRDCAGGWHVGTISSWNLANENLTMRLSLYPPLRPGGPGTAEALTLEVIGNTEHLTADLTVRW